MSRCRTCGAKLSQYRPEGTVHCAAHEPDHITHLDYIDHITLPRIPVLTGPGTCAKGHDLNVHGRMRNAGGGRITRLCRICAAERARTYRLRKAAA